MKKLVKVYIDLPAMYDDADVIKDYFTCALGRAYHGALHPFDPRHVLGEAMTVESIQVGRKRRAKKEPTE